MLTKISCAVAILLFFFLTAVVMAGPIQNSRLLPTDKVTVYDSGKKIGEFTREMPVPEGLSLSCVGKCAVKLEEMSLVAEDQSRFSISLKNKTMYLEVDDGVVYFGISSLATSIVFMTPAGAVSLNQLYLNVSSGTKMLEGYIKVSENSSEVGVIDGGNLQLLTNDGRELLKPGEKFILAQADIGGEIMDPAGTTDDSVRVGSGALFQNFTSGQIAFGTTVGIAGGASLLGAIVHDKDKSRDASPFLP